MCYGQIIGDAMVTARKAHACHWCGESIIPGTKYERWAEADAETIVTTKAHAECRAAWRKANAYYGPDFCVEPGTFRRGSEDER